MKNSLFISILCLLSVINVKGQDWAIDNTFLVGTGFGNGDGGFGISGLALQPDKKIIVVGLLGSYNGTVVKNIVRLKENGELDPNFVIAGSGFDAGVETVVIQPDGKIIVGGSFTNYNGTSRKGILRLNSNGSLDDTFDAGNEIIKTRCIALQADGKIVVGGLYTAARPRPLS